MIKLDNITKLYDLGEIKINALDDISLEIGKGEFVTIMGPSGSGKSTLLHILGLLDNPSNGTYFIETYDTTTLPDRELSRIRNQHFGFVFQSFNLFPELNALDNVAMPLAYAGIPRGKRRAKAKELLRQVGLAHRVYHFPHMMSGGEQQRVAIARALANEPTLILADEPTGNLPSDMGNEILSILYRLNEEQNVTLVMVTHDDDLGRCGKRQIRLQDGKIVSDGPVTDRYKPMIEEAV